MPENDFIRFFKPEIGEDEINEVISCLKSGWLTTASRVRRFEADFAEYTGSGHAVALNSCTAALHLALEAAGLKEKEVVLVPTMTFASTAEVVRYFNAYPVLVDCNEDDLCMDMSKAADILEKLSRKEKVNGVPEDFAGIRAMIPVHYGGQVADVIKCGELRDKYAIALIEDCAHTCPAYFKDASGKWQMAGSTADVACFSFYANKTITTGEGGMAVTNNRDWADRMRIMSLHGISKDAWKRFDKSGSWYYEITAPGFKYNMPDTAAAIGIHQLKKADRFFEQRRAIARRLIEGLRDIPGIITPVEKPDRKHSWHLFIIRVNNPPSGIDRNTFIEKLKEKGIGTSVHYMPLHMHPYYMKKYLYCNEDFPVATKIFNQIISLPIYPGLTDNEIQRILDAVKKTALGD